MHEFDQGSAPPEKLLTLKQAAEALGLPYFKLQRAAKCGLLDTYRFYNSRPLVRLSEVIAVVECSRQSAANLVPDGTEGAQT